MDGQWKNVRDGIMFFGGLAGVIYETLATAIDRPVLLALFGAMMGLPFFIRADERRNGGNNK